MALTKEQLFKRRLNRLMGYREGKYELDELVDATMSCIAMKDQNEPFNDNSVKLVRDSLYQLEKIYGGNLGDRSFHEYLIKELYPNELLIPVDVAESVAEEMFGFLSSESEATGVTISGQEILDRLPYETYVDLIQRIRNNSLGNTGKLNLLDLNGLNHDTDFARIVLSKDYVNIEKNLLGWGNFPANKYTDNVIAYHNFSIAYDLTIEWELEVDDEYKWADFVIYGDISTVKDEEDTFGYVHVTINGNVYHGRTLDEAVSVFMQSKGLYSSDKAVSEGIIDNSEREFYDKDPVKYVNRHFGLYKETLPVKQFKGHKTFIQGFDAPLRSYLEGIGYYS